MAALKKILGFIDAGREIRRAPLVGMEFLHEGAMGAGDVRGTRSRLQAKDLVGLLLGHFGAAPRALPRCRITLSVLTPTGLPAVQIRHQ